MWLPVFTKSISRSRKSCPDVLALTYIIGVASKSFKQIVHLTKGSKYGVNLKIALITVSHIASCNLRNLFLEVRNLVQLYYF